MSKDIDHIKLDGIDRKMEEHETLLKHYEEQLMKLLSKVQYRKEEIRKLSLQRTETLNLKLDLPEEKKE